MRHSNMNDSFLAYMDVPSKPASQIVSDKDILCFCMFCFDSHYCDKCQMLIIELSLYTDQVNKEGWVQVYHHLPSSTGRATS